MIHRLTLRKQDCIFFSIFHMCQTPEYFKALNFVRQHRKIDIWADILQPATRHDTQDPPASLTAPCLDLVFSLEFPSVECFYALYSSWFIPTWLKYEVWWREYYALFQLLWLILCHKSPPSIDAAPLVNIPGWSYVLSEPLGSSPSSDWATGQLRVNIFSFTCFPFNFQNESDDS